MIRVCRLRRLRLLKGGLISLPDVELVLAFGRAEVTVLWRTGCQVRERCAGRQKDAFCIAFRAAKVRPPRGVTCHLTLSEVDSVPKTDICLWLQTFDSDLGWETCSFVL